MCLFVICISSFVRGLFKSLAHFLSGFLIFLLLNFIIDTSPTLDIHFANIVPKYATYLFIPLTVSLVEQKLLILIKSMGHFFFNVLCFGAVSKENQHAVIFTLLNFLCIFVEISWLHLYRSSWYILICVYFLPIPCCLGFYNFIVNQELWIFQFYSSSILFWLF